LAEKWIKFFFNLAVKWIVSERWNFSKKEFRTITFHVQTIVFTRAQRQFYGGRPRDLDPPDSEFRLCIGFSLKLENTKNINVFNTKSSTDPSLKKIPLVTAKFACRHIFRWQKSIENCLLLGRTNTAFGYWICTVILCTTTVERKNKNHRNIPTQCNPLPNRLSTLFDRRHIFRGKPYQSVRAVHSW